MVDNEYWNGDMLQTCHGFTPSPDVLASELGMAPANAYGAMWRYCQQDGRVCNASIKTIASRIGVGYWAAREAVLVVCEAGLMVDVTPGLRNHPHTYWDASRPILASLVEKKRGRVAYLEHNIR